MRAWLCRFHGFSVNCEDFREYYKKVIYDVGKPFSFCYTETNGLDSADRVSSKTHGKLSGYLQADKPEI